MGVLVCRLAIRLCLLWAKTTGTRVGTGGLCSNQGLSAGQEVCAGQALLRGIPAHAGGWQQLWAGPGTY